MNIRQSAIAGVAAASILTLSACASTTLLKGTSMVPAAEAETSVEADGNDNAVVKMSIKHLADPERLSRSRELYLLWAEVGGERTYPLGKLVVNDEGTGELTAVVPFEEFRLILTAEDGLSANAPSSDVVFRSELLSRD